MMTEFYVGEIVEFHVPGRMILGDGTLVKILKITGEWAEVTTGCGCWLEKLENLRKIQ
ncbi:hypothetical protein [Acinetobacter sp. Ver3]|uniref:hypothetical protein n=1 Tax=Acinetobacter sp. Ver3 TaxID=466088 RepID=UPI001489D0D4|nr:hypothetical protein [Acinetobacter sp. Ver3]